MSDAQLIPESKGSTKYGWFIAGVYFIGPLLLAAIVYCRWSGWFSSDNPVYLWRFLYCFLAGCWGLAVRAYERRRGLSAWPDYFVLYPLVLVMNAAAVFTVLTLFHARLGQLFWTAALPLAMVLGRHCSPSEWGLTKLVDEARDKAKRSLDRPA